MASIRRKEGRMPRGARVKTKWVKKEARAPLMAVKLQLAKPDGLSELAHFLETSKPADVLHHLRQFQDTWCNHYFQVLAAIKKDDKFKTIIRCTQCSLTTTGVKNA